MMRSMYAAISGLKVHQTMLDVTANDIANVNTIGYKSQRTTFKDALSQMQRGGSAPTTAQGGSNAVQVGLGVQLNSIDNLMSTGAMQTTGNVLDVAVQGDGWFRVATLKDRPPTFTVVGGAPSAPDAYAPAIGGAIAVQDQQYTRAGNFTRNADGYLVTQDGYYVLGHDPAANVDHLICIPPGSTNVAIGPDGSVSFDPPAAVTVRDRITPLNSGTNLSLAKFANEGGLERISSNRWAASSASGAEQPGIPGGSYGLTTSGATEMSNVDLAQEFTNMISAQRGFQANSRVISTADQMLSDLVNLIR